jgi:hypothetical protein
MHINLNVLFLTYSSTSPNICAYCANCFTACELQHNRSIVKHSSVASLCNFIFSSHVNSFAYCNKPHTSCFSCEVTKPQKSAVTSFILNTDKARGSAQRMQTSRQNFPVHSWPLLNSRLSKFQHQIHHLTSSLVYQPPSPPISSLCRLSV